MALVDIKIIGCGGDEIRVTVIATGFESRQ